jgi:hypothetical protein
VQAILRDVGSCRRNYPFVSPQPLADMETSDQSQAVSPAVINLNDPTVRALAFSFGLDLFQLEDSVYKFLNSVEGERSALDLDGEHAVSLLDILQNVCLFVFFAVVEKRLTISSRAGSLRTIRRSLHGKQRFAKPFCDFLGNLESFRARFYYPEWSLSRSFWYLEETPSILARVRCVTVSCRINHYLDFRLVQ